MSCVRKLVLVIHRDRDIGQQITEGLLRRRVPACLVSDPSKLARLVSTFQVHYLIVDVEIGSPLEVMYRDWSSTPAIPVIDLSGMDRVEIDAICQTVALDLA